MDGGQLGNPVLEFTTDFNSRAEYFWSHGLISDGTYGVFTSVCNYSRYVSEYYGGSLSPLCARVMNQVTRETSRFVNKYDVTLDVCLSSVLSQSKILTPHAQVCFLVASFNSQQIWFVMSDRMKNVQSSTTESLCVCNMQQQVGKSIDVCVEDETVRYLNRKDVQAALHARLVGVRKWEVCSR
jgi:serine carboxypeptidase-like clade II